MKTINLNDYVYVKLTKFGKEFYYHRNDLLIDEGFNITRQYPIVDEEGYSRFKLCDFMNIYGAYMNMSAGLIVEDGLIYIEHDT